MKRKRKTTIIERVEIVDQYINEDSVFAELRDRGFRVTRAGPYATKAMFPTVDPDWFMLTAERIRIPELGVLLEQMEEC